MVDLMNCELGDKTTKIEELEAQLLKATTATPSPVATTTPVTESSTVTTQTDLTATELAEQVTHLAAKEAELLALTEKRIALELELESLRSEYEQTHQQLTTSQQSVAEHTRQYKDLELTVTSLQTQLTAKTAELTRLNNTSDLNAAMRERLVHLEQEVAAAGAHQVEASRRHAREVAELRERLSETETALQTRDVDLTQRGTEIFEILERRTELEADVSRLQAENGELGKSLESMRGKVVEVEKTLEAAVTSHAEQTARLEEKIDVLTGRIPCVVKYIATKYILLYMYC